MKMEKRELAEVVEQQQYFEAVEAPSPEQDEGTREMGPTWVKNLCSNGKLDNAIKRAEDNINAAIEADDLENQSYSYVYKVFK